MKRFLILFWCASAFAQTTPSSCASRFHAAQFSIQEWRFALTPGCTTTRIARPPSCLTRMLQPLVSCATLRRSQE